MSLWHYFFESPQKRKLAHLLWRDNWSGSIHELSQLSELNYATTYETLKKLEKYELVKSALKGRARVYTSNLDHETRSLLLKLMKDNASEPKYSGLTELGAPLVNEKLTKEPQPLEALLSNKVLESKDNATLLRTLPAVLLKNRAVLNPKLLLAHARRNDVVREMGFLLELTSHLSTEKRFMKWSKEFYDRRWQKDHFYFPRDNQAGFFKRSLVEKNTPPLAKKWRLRMNVDLDSYRKILEAE